MNQQRENSFERFSIIRETWHLDPLRRRLLRSHFFDALSSLISVKVESKLRRGETSRRIRTARNVESFEEFPLFFLPFLHALWYNFYNYHLSWLLTIP